jgi:NAD(P)-dependent dehydrogenase (short-subunit alcohol dehydrogenase family)
MKMDLTGKVALVTGGAQRVGRILCLGLAKAGADIVMNYWKTEADAYATQKEIEALGRRCLSVEADITDVNQSAYMIDRVEKEFGRLDILVHNASNFNEAPFLEVTEKIWESSLGVNLKGPFFLSQAAAKLMMKNKAGRIIALIGNSYYENWPNFIPHAIAKVGLAKLIQSLAITLSPYIQCNAICPAVIFPSANGQDLRILASRGESHAGDQYEKFRDDTLLHRGTPEEVAELVVYLAGCSNYLSGAVIPIDGGKSAL